MGLRIGIDFGTATTCVAIVRDVTTLATELVTLDGSGALVESKVWIDRNDQGLPLVGSKSSHNRSPQELFSDADRRFRSYWSSRVEAWKDGRTKSAWLDAKRESSLLLSFFKPELADHPVASTERRAVRTYYAYNPMAQYEDLTTYYEDRVIADPAPDTTDLVSATAAILRRTVERAVGVSRERVDLIMIGTPSVAANALSEDGRHARRRRDEAVELANLRRDFGSADFRVEYLGEAEAASYGLDASDAGANELHSIIIDMGAGTTDLALVRMVRDKSGRLVPDRVPISDSVRQAGRDINEAVADALRVVDQDCRRAMAAMDQRALQVFMDERIEHIKRILTNEDRAFMVPFTDLASHAPGSEHDSQLCEDLRRVATPVIGLRSGALERALDSHLRSWTAKLETFLKTCATYTHGESDVPLRIELVGGGLRFPPARERVKLLLKRAGLDHAPIQFRDVASDSQKVVARGLARRAALLD